MKAGAWWPSGTESPLVADRTLHQDHNFWSSTGSDADTDEYLIYSLREPLCQVQYVRIAPFRALFHHGCASCV